MVQYWLYQDVLQRHSDLDMFVFACCLPLSLPRENPYGVVGNVIEILICWPDSVPGAMLWELNVLASASNEYCLLDKPVYMGHALAGSGVPSCKLI